MNAKLPSSILTMTYADKDVKMARTQGEDAIILGLLDAVEGNATLTQRDLARELGIALGLVNSYLKRCVRKGLLKASEIPARRYAYYLTPQGFAEKSRLTARYLSVSFSLLRRAREDFEFLFDAAKKKGFDRILLLGEGDVADVAQLVAMHSKIQIVAILPSDKNVRYILKAAKSCNFDAVIVTAMIDPQQAYKNAIAAFGAKCVSAPSILRIRELETRRDEA